VACASFDYVRQPKVRQVTWVFENRAGGFP
jgi:hypothetical protein